MKITEIITEAVKQRLDAKCWKGKHKEGTKIKGGVRVNNCVPNESVEETAAWQKKSGKNKNGGLNKKGVASYRKQHPGSKLKTAVTKKPSEIKAGSKDAKRRKSFCARMKGMKKHNTSAKTKNDPDSRINKSLRKWHCESVEELQDMLMIAESKIFEVMHESHKNDFIKPFLPFAKEYLQINQLPLIKVVDRIPGADGTTFGCFSQTDKCIYIVSNDRHPKDVLRTLAHELVHYKQDLQDQLDTESGITGSEEENEANATAGVIMRNYSEQNPE